MTQPKPKYNPSQTVEYQGKRYSIEENPQYRLDYNPPGYFYDLSSPELKRIPEQELYNPVTPNEFSGRFTAKAIAGDRS